MRMRWGAAALVIVSLVSVVGIAAQVRPQAALAQLKTTAERSDYRETSRYDDVVAFLNTVAKAAPQLVKYTTFGYTTEGRALPLAVAGRVADARPETVKASGKVRVYIQGNVHAGEVEGKEAAQALVRDIAMGRHADWLDSMVLLVGPIYNADGNERVSLLNRGVQNGPIAGMGTRPNAQGLNINRDYMKLDTPEARSMVKLLNDYDPHIMMDLHTTDGSYHAYHLTYEVPNNPAVEPAIALLARNDWMPAMTRAIKSKYGWDFHFYGNVSGGGRGRGGRGGRGAVSGEDQVWATVEDLPRYSHNYWGLRNRFGILEETYSYLTFKDRVETASRFLEEVLNFAHANAARIKKIAEESDTRSIIGQQLSLRSKLKRDPQKVEILMGETEDEMNPYTGRTMLRRRDVRRPEQMWNEATFEAAETERVPTAYYVPAELRAAIERLQTHGIKMERISQPSTLQLEEFQIAASETQPQAFENHRERAVTGKYALVERTLPAGTYRIPMNQPLARLAFYLLEPHANDGLLTWNFLDDALKDSKYPILRTRN